MAKTSVSQTGKELNRRSGVVLAETERIKRNAGVLLQALKQQEAMFIRRENEERMRLKNIEQQELMRTQTKAWTMPDEEVPASEEVAPVKEVAKEPVKEPAIEVQQPVAKEEQPAPVQKTEEEKPAPVVKAPEEVKEPVKKQAEAPKPAKQPIRQERQPATHKSSGAAQQERRSGGYSADSRQQRRTSAPFNKDDDSRQRGADKGNYNRPQQDKRFQPRNKQAQEEVLMPSLEKDRVSNYDPNKKSYNRRKDPERVSKNKRQSMLHKNDKYSVLDDDRVRGGRKKQVKKQPSAQQMMAPIKIEKAYMTAETITVKDLTERIGKPAGEILKKLLLLGVIANINSELDYDTASIVSSEFGVELEMKLEKSAEDVLTEIQDEDDSEEDLKKRPPVITIMGHVDHGKTSLLDYIRRSRVTSTEAGGITQHIGAYTVEVDGETITFLDTPGHEAFTAMRARGAQATDIAILVVAADDGVMPQTVEAINHAKAANVPIIVAVNKMDKMGANPDRIKQDLTSYGLVPEEWGGDTIMVEISAKTGQGIDQLLEMILLQAEMLQLKANPDRLARGIIIEAKLDKARGSLATVLLQNGTLHVGDYVVAGHASGRVRVLNNDKGISVESAGPSMPVEIAGFSEVPGAGDELYAVEDEKLTRQVAEERKEKMRSERLQASSKVSLDNLFTTISEGKIETLNLIIKADVQGSAEAVRQSLEKLSTDQVNVKVLHSAVGAISKDDVNLALAFNAIIIGFNIRPDSNARDLAESEDVDIRLYRVIYQAIEDIEKAMKGLLEPELKEEILGHAQVRSTFKVSGIGTIAGCYVTDGKLQRNAKVRLLRDNVVIYEGKLSSLRRFKDDVKEVSEGYECGAGIENYNDIKEGDEIECYNMVEVEA
ncbi:MAG: translation initiation factor IF-2 [Eubacteriales bacterium]|nr:translation initiation factor IF-2 [Eubacteriales bacterium]